MARLIVLDGMFVGLVTRLWVNGRFEADAAELTRDGSAVLGLATDDC